MTDKLSLGKTNTLLIQSRSNYGLYLTDNLQNRVLLPNIYVKNTMNIGDKIDVFIYKDSQDRIVATTQTPYAKLGEFAYLKATDITPFGTFVDWGLPKELLIPKKMQKSPMKIFQKYIVYITYDIQTDRLIADTRIGRYLRYDVSLMHSLKTVNILIIAQTPLGYKTIVNNQFEGMIYHNEIYENIKIGDRKEAFVKKVRKDGKLDLTLSPPKDQKENLAKEKIITLLQKNKTLPFTYKSDAKKIQKLFEVSKKTYKKALTTLINEKIVVLKEDSICLNTDKI